MQAAAVVRSTLCRLAGVFVAAVLALALVQAGPPRAAAQTSAEWEPEELYLYMEDEDLEELYTRDVYSDDRLPGHVVYGPTGETHELRGLRFRGATSRLHPKKSFNIRFEEPQAFLFGSDRMNLKAMYSDPLIMRETIAMSLSHELGQPASRTRYFDLWINDVYEGLYIHVERVDGDLATHAGLDHDGTIVRDRFRFNPDYGRSAFSIDLDALDDGIDLVELLEENFDERTANDDSDWDALAELVTWAYETAPGPAFAAGLEARVDVDNLIDFLLLHHFASDVDSFGDDYFMYLDHSDADARWHFIPWDKDLAFGSQTRIQFGGLNDFFTYEYGLDNGIRGHANHLFRDVLATPELNQRLAARARHLMDEVLTPDWYEALVAEVAAAIKPSVQIEPGPDDRFQLHPQNHFGALGRFDEHLEAILDFGELRWAFMDREFNPVEGVPYEAEAAVDEGSVGERVLFTDADGWTIAALDVQAVRTPGDIAFSVAHQADIDGIDRVYRVASTADIDARMTLYYRNEVIDPHHLPGENWYAADVAVGDQDDLLLWRRSDGRSVTSIPTRVNPFSNKVVGDVTLAAQATSFAIAHRAPTLEPQPDPPAGAVERAAGRERIETALRISQRRPADDTVETVVVARSDEYADALAGAPLAASLDAPLLLTDRAQAVPGVLDELERLGAQHVLLLGGQAALDEAVASDLAAAGLTTERIAGANRFATAELIAARLGGDEAFVAEGAHADPGRGWPDALTAAAAAAASGSPVLLVTRDTLPAETRRAVEDGGLRSLVVVGGTAAVSETVVADLAGEGREITRLSGADRYETAAGVAQLVQRRGGDANHVWLATGHAYPDALAAGPAVAAGGGILLLTDPDDLALSPPTAFWLGVTSTASHVVMVGGRAAISPRVEAQVRNLVCSDGGCLEDEPVTPSTPPRSPPGSSAIQRPPPARGGVPFHAH